MDDCALIEISDVQEHVMSGLAQYESTDPAVQKRKCEQMGGAWVATAQGGFCNMIPHPGEQIEQSGLSACNLPPMFSCPKGMHIDYQACRCVEDAKPEPFNWVPWAVLAGAILLVGLALMKGGRRGPELPA